MDLNQALALIGVIGAVVGALISGVVTWKVTRTQLWRELQSQSEELGRRREAQEEAEAERGKAVNDAAELQKVCDKYQVTKKKLAGSGVVREHVQPVLLLGPKYVGKTSLLWQWHAPWDHRSLSGTVRHRMFTLPVYSRTRPEREPHYADPDVRTEIDDLIKLRIHDFPGEVNYQPQVINRAIEETDALAKWGHDVGVVLVCMFDASEAADGRLSGRTLDYYNGEMLRELRRLSSEGKVYAQRIVIIFNKFDLLIKQQPDSTEDDLMQLCSAMVKETLDLLKGVGGEQKITEVPTVLDRATMKQTSRGASIALGEVARGIVAAVAGQRAARETYPDLGTTYFSDYAQEPPPRADDDPEPQDGEGA